MPPAPTPSPSQTTTPPLLAHHTCLSSTLACYRHVYAPAARVPDAARPRRVRVRYRYDFSRLRELYMTYKQEELDVYENTAKVCAHAVGLPLIAQGCPCFARTCHALSRRLTATHPSAPMVPPGGHRQHRDQFYGVSVLQR